MMEKQNKKLLTINNELRIKIENFNSECTGCMICMDNCSMHISHEINPLSFTSQILELNNVDLETVYSCNGCNSCNSPCPKNLDFGNLILKIKRFSFDKSNTIPISNNGYNSVRFHQYFSSSRFFTWQNKDINSNIAFFPGCSLSATNPNLSVNIFNFLKGIYPSITVLNQCCSNPLESIGDQKNFTKSFDILKSKIVKSGINELIVSCPNCYKMFTKYTKSLPLKIIFITEVLALPSNLLNLENNYSSQIKYNISQITSSNRSIVIHDPCPLRESDSIHNSIRSILVYFKINYTELTYKKTNTICCGSGAMLKSISNISFQKYKKHIDSLYPINSIVVSYCNECVENFNLNSQISSIHILNLIFNVEKTDLLDNKSVSLKNKWVNRYKYNQKLKF